MFFYRNFKKFYTAITMVCLLFINNNSLANVRNKNSTKTENNAKIERKIEVQNLEKTIIDIQKKSTIDSDELITKEEELPLKLHNIIDLALERNLETKQAYIQVKLAEYDLMEAKSNYYPTIKLSGGYSRADGDSYYDAREGLNGSISANYSLFAFGKYMFNVKAVDYALSSMKYKENSIIQNIIFEVVENYYKLLSLKAQKEAAVEDELLSYEAYKAANLKYKLGLVPLVDKLKANTSYSEKKLNTIKIENEIKKQKANLNIVLNLEPDYVLYVENPEIKVKGINKKIDYFLSEAKINRPDLKALYEQKKQKEQELNRIRTQFLPEFSVSGAISTDKNISKGSNKKAYTDNSVSLNVSVPLFNGFSDVASTKSKKKEIESLDLQIKQLEKQISNEVWSCYQDFNTNQVAFMASKNLLKSAEENAKINLGMYKNGKASILEVLDSQSQLKEARMEFINSKYNWIVYRIKLLKTMGKMDLNNIINIGDL